MSLETEVTRVAGGAKSALKTLINKLGGNIVDEPIDQYDTLIGDLDIVTTDGGASMNVDAALGAGPYTIEITEDAEDGILAASQVSFNGTISGMESTTVQGAINELFQDVSEGKSLIAAAVTGKGVQTAANDTFETMATNINNIETGVKTDNVIYGVFRGNVMQSTVTCKNQQGTPPPSDVVISGLASLATGESTFYFYGGKCSNKDITFRLTGDASTLSLSFDRGASEQMIFGDYDIVCYK